LISPAGGINLTKTETGDSNSKILDQINEKDEDESLGYTDGSSSMKMSKSKGKWEYENITLEEIDEKDDDESGSFNYS